jgi:hypothetical protein
MALPGTPPHLGLAPPLARESDPPPVPPASALEKRLESLEQGLLRQADAIGQCTVALDALTRRLDDASNREADRDAALVRAFAAQVSRDRQQDDVDAQHRDTLAEVQTKLTFRENVQAGALVGVREGARWARGSLPLVLGGALYHLGRLLHWIP